MSSAAGLVSLPLHVDPLVTCDVYIGVPLIDGGTVRLPALVGLSRALDMILTGRPVDAREALSIGMANHNVSQVHVIRMIFRSSKQGRS